MKKYFYLMLFSISISKLNQAQVVPQGFLIGPDWGVVIGEQIWDTVNLNVTKYSNNESITLINNLTEWNNYVNSNSTYPVTFSYNFNNANDAVYGKLYNWYAVNDSRGICPVGWHVPSNTDFTTLNNFIKGNGGALKEVGTAHWLSPNVGAVDTYGFTALPAGYQGTYQPSNQGKLTYFWTSTAYNTSQAYAWSLTKDAASFTGDFNYGKIAGFSVRCIRN